MLCALATGSFPLYWWSCNHMASENSLLTWVKINTTFFVTGYFSAGSVNWADLLRGHEIASFDGKKEAEMRSREGAEVRTSGLCFSMACDLWSLEAIHETVSSVCAYLNSFIMLIVKYLVIYKNCQKFGWYTGHAAGIELKPFTSGLTDCKKNMNKMIIRSDIFVSLGYIV